MSRFRAPQARSSLYITREGYGRLKAEYDRLWRVRRPEVVRALAAAAAEGDRSENAEYIYRKKELREIDRRVRYLQTRLPLLKVPDQLPADRSRVFFGAWVEVVDQDDVRKTYRIVGPDESDAAEGKVSMDAPLAKLLLKKAAGDVVNLEVAGSVKELEIITVRYEQE
jgi:transcription elongation factor GreB